MLAEAIPNISFLWTTPFIAMLLAIATAPFIHKHWWEKNYPYVVALFGIVASSYYFFGHGPMHRWVEGMEEYVSFIILLAALFKISGGIVIKVTRKATPTVNVVLLLTGAVIANLFGTTVAAVFQPGFFDLLDQMRHGGSALVLMKMLVSREVLMLAAAVASRLLTPHTIYEHNEFGFGPIREVAILFAGIFATMIPAIQFM